ncbi:MAG: hypothetical protein RL653_1132 [Pseudomonadota bacterium]
MAGKKKREVHEEHENHERWLVSYADFITLLFAFFVVLYATGRQDQQKKKQVSESIRWAMHFQGHGGGESVGLVAGRDNSMRGAGNAAGGQKASRARAEALRKQLEKKLKPYLVDKGISNAVQVSTEDGKLTIRLAASRFFDAGLAQMNPDLIPVLDAIALELKAVDNPVNVEGHTDAGALASDKYRNNWDLSAARAVTVVNYLEKASHFDPRRLSAVGYGSTRPLNPGDTPEAREENRRIELVMELGLSDGRGLPIQ